jgi:nicotinamidase-related amidase
MTLLCDASRSVLVVIDLQQRLMPAIHEGEAVVKNALALARAAHTLGVPVVGTAQYPEGLGPNVPEVQALCDPVIAKLDFDACAEPALLAALPPERDQLIVVGCEAHVCVLQTVLGLVSRDRKVRVVADAIGSRAPHNKAIAIDRMRAAGAELLSTEMVLFEWLRDCRHAKFKELLNLIK